MGVAYGSSTIYQATKGIVQDGLVLNLDAGVKQSYDGGTTWRDLKGDNNGTLTNDPTFDRDKGGSIVFDGSDDYVNCGQNFSITSNNSFSLSVWVSPSSTGNWQGILQRGRNVGSWYGIWQYGSKFIFGISASTNLTSSSNLSVGFIYNVTVTQNTSGRKLYINGILDTSTSSYYSGSDPSADLTVGSAHGSEYFNGEIFVALVYSRSLTATEVAQNFNVTRHRFGI